MEDNKYYAEFIQWWLGFPIKVQTVDDTNKDNILVSFTIIGGRQFGKEGEVNITPDRIQRWEDWKLKMERCAASGGVCNVGLII